MRFTPDIVLVGEISTSNAGALWRLTGTGHGAMMTSIHASSVDQCYDVLYERISGCIPNLDREKTVEKIRENFRSEEHTSELQSLMRISYAVFCLKKKNHYNHQYNTNM